MKAKAKVSLVKKKNVKPEAHSPTTVGLPMNIRHKVRGLSGQC